MKIIKCERQVRLDELLEHIFDNQIKGEVFENGGSDVQVDIHGSVMFDEWISKSDLFTITEEVEITEEIEMKRLVCVHTKTNNISCYNDVSIEEALNLASFNKLTFKKIYLQNDDGSIGELIWKDGEMVD